MSNKRTIWKFKPQPQQDYFKVNLPKNASILHVAEQHGGLAFWAMVDPEAEKEDAVFRIYGTGWEIADDCEYVGTFMQHGGAFVWHLFRVTRP
jgi:hypothetical protein